MSIGFAAGTPVADGRGVAYHPVRSDAVSRPVIVRVLTPAVMPVVPRLLLALPMFEDHSVCGDGLELIRSTGLHERYGLIVAAPECPIAWAADHPSDPLRREETHLTAGVLPWLRERFPSAAGTMAVGLSRSGWAAVALVLRHPELVDAAACFDAPLMKRWPGVYDMAEVFATPANFDRYRPELLIPQRARLLAQRPRLALYGHGIFRSDMEGCRALMASLGLSVTYSGAARAHTWGSGWLEEAVTALVEMVPAPASRTEVPG